MDRFSKALQEIERAAAPLDIYYRGIADRDDGSGALLFVYRVEKFEHYFTTGFFPTVGEAVEFSRDVFTTLPAEEIEMNIFKNNKLFPHIKGVMLKEQRVTLHMSGRVNVVEMREDAKARAEIFFEDHAKSAIINANQLADIGAVYGGETQDWKGKPVVLYGEHGTWFGRETWGIRVDKGATEAAAKKHARNQPTPAPDDVPSDNGNKERDEQRKQEVDDIADVAGLDELPFGPDEDDQPEPAGAYAE